MKKEKIFVLGIGAPKAGTTWLYEYIKSSPEANLGQLKEYQFWNMVFFKDNKKRHKLLNKPQLNFDSDDFLRWSMITRKSFYEIYFNSIINSGYRITGDISPQYALLSSRDFEYIRKRLEACGFIVKLIYFIRNPVERIWSNIRMEKKLFSSISSEMSDSDAVKLTFKQDRWRFDSKYDSVIGNLRVAFEERDTYIGIYEEMFAEDNVRELSNFVGIDFNPMMIHKKINSSEKKEQLDADVIREIKSFYKNTYEFCYQNFPQTRELWKN